MKEKDGYCFWQGCRMSEISEEEQEECDYYDGDCCSCDKYKED